MSCLRKEERDFGVDNGVMAQKSSYSLSFKGASRCHAKI